MDLDEGPCLGPPPPPPQSSELAPCLGPPPPSGLEHNSVIETIELHAHDTSAPLNNIHPPALPLKSSGLVPCLGLQSPPPQTQSSELGHGSVIESTKLRTHDTSAPLNNIHPPTIPALPLKSNPARHSPASSPSKRNALNSSASRSPHALTTPHVQYKVLERLGKGYAFKFQYQIIK